MKKIIGILSLVLAMAIFAAPVQASSLPVYSGDFMFVYNENDGGPDAMKGLVAEINKWFKDNKNIENYITELYEVDRYENKDGGVSGPILNVSYTSDDYKSGTWESSIPIEFYLVKGAKQLAVFWLGYEGATSGTWTSAHLTTPNGKNIPELSHLTIYNPPQTPIPAAAWLLGSGIAGLGVLRRRMK